MNIDANNEKTLLYYPTIRIEDGIWLRNAILYWDKVSSIVPGMNFEEENTAEIEYLRREGIYEPIYPFELGENRQLCGIFCQQVKENIKSRRHLASCRRRIHEEKLQMVDMVHIDKTPQSILDYLLDEGIAQRNCDGVWINMNTTDADIYMATLARFLAYVHGNTEIGTDKRRNFLYPYSRKNVNSLEQSDIYLNIALQEILPVPNMDIPLENIIYFKKEHQRELRSFMYQIEDFQYVLKHCENVEEIKEQTLRFRRHIDENLDEIEELMKKQKIQGARKALQLLIPVGGQIIATSMELPVLYSAIITGIAEVTVNFISHHAGEMNNENSAYLFHARKNEIILPRVRTYI